MPFVTAADGCRLHYTLHGPADAPALLIGYPWNDGMAALLSADPSLGQTEEEMIAANRAVVAGFAERYRVVQMDYPRGMAPSDPPREGDLTADTVASDYLAFADAAGVERFVTVGFSWSANAALQVASRTERCAGVAVGGWPPLSAPYEALLELTRAPLPMLEAGDPQGSFLNSIANYFASIVGPWAEVKEGARLTGPRIAFVGSEDRGVPGSGVSVDLAGPTIERRAELEALGWEVVIFDGLDHMQAGNDADLIVRTVRATLDKHTW